MSVAIGIGDFGDDHTQLAFGVVDQPEGHGVEDVPQDTRLRQKLDPPDVLKTRLIQKFRFFRQIFM